MTRERIEVSPDRPGGVGFTVELQPSMQLVERGSTLRAVERSGRGRALGELAVALFHPNLIMDRDGVLWDSALGLARAMVAAPRCGYTLPPFQVELAGSVAWRVEAVVQRDEAGEVPALPYHGAIAIGHPDPRLSAALLVTVRSAGERWAAGFAMLDSLRFTGRAAASYQPSAMSFQLALADG